MNRSTKKHHLGLALLAIACAGGFAASCDDSDSDPTIKVDSGAANDAGSTADAGAGTDAATTLSLYDRLGGKAGLESFVETVVKTKIIPDADLKTFFFNQVASPIPAGHPSTKQITVCFGRFIGTALGKDTYPGAAVNDTANTNTPNFTCRNMADSHKAGISMLRIGNGTFDKFIGHIATSLMPLVKPTATKAGEITQLEFDTLAGALAGQKGDITTTGAAAAAGPFPN